MAYLEQEGQDTPFLQTTKKAIHEAIGIPERSLVRVLNALKAEGKIFYRVKRGRYGGLRLASIVSIFQSMIRLKKERQEAYLASLSGFFSEPLTLVKQAVLGLDTSLRKGQQLSLFERDIG